MRKRLVVKQGDKYGRLTIVKELETKQYARYFECICDCGKIKTSKLSNLRKNSSCGCYRKEIIKEVILKNIKHGHTTIDTKSTTYNSWYNMKRRCYYPKSINYEYYGGRGIKVCNRWLDSFKNFLEDMGPRPKGTTIDRIDVNGNYEPSNCRWSTITEQNRNRRKHV